MRDYPFIYSQRDPQWAAQRLGTVDGATIGQYGCILTCDAMKAGYYGHEIKPNALDDIYTNRGLYVQGDLLPDIGIHQVFDDVQLIEIANYTNTPADLAHLQSLAQDPTITVTIEVDFDHDPNDGIQTHFIELHDYDGTTLTIYDPWYGQPDNFATHYGTDPAKTIQKFSVYKGIPVKTQMTVDPDVFGKLVKNSTSYDAVCDEIGKPHDSEGTIVITEIARLKADKATAEQTVNALTGLKTTNDQLEGQIATLQQQLEDAQKAMTHPDTGLDYKDLYNQAESDLIKKGRALEELQQTYNKAMGQYKNTSVELVPTTVLAKKLLARWFGLN